MKRINDCRQAAGSGANRECRGFTLVELLVVMLIILLVSALALPTVLPAISHRQVSEAARLLHGALVGARDAAIHNNSLSGIRLLPDPGFPVQYALDPKTNTVKVKPITILAANRLVPIQPGPNYGEGYINITSPLSDLANGIGPTAIPYPTGSGVYPYPSGLAGSVLLVEQSVYDPKAPGLVPNPPTSWFWNIRVGDKIQINNSGDYYTVVGPINVAPWNPTTPGQNPELFVNVGNPGTVSPLVRPFPAPPIASLTTCNPEFLFLVNGQDDNGNGLIDEGWNGLDDNLDGIVDDLGEWETETWLGSIQNILTTITVYPGPLYIYGSLQNRPYTIVRRPVPVANAREVVLPSDVVIDMTTVLSTQERSRFPVGTINPFTGYVDIVLTPGGDVVPTSIYSTPASAGMSSSFLHFWLAERGDLYPVQTAANGSAVPLVPTYNFLLPMPLGSNVGATPNAYDNLVSQYPGLQWLRGEMRVVTLFSRSGQIATNENPVFNVNNVSQPFIAAQQGAQGGP